MNDVSRGEDQNLPRRSSSWADGVRHDGCEIYWSGRKGFDMRRACRISRLTPGDDQMEESVTDKANRVEEMIEALRRWQGIERKSMEQTAEIMENTDNSVIRMMMEIIRQDSMMHHRVQQFIIDSLTREAVSLSPEEVGEIWEKIEEHDEMEREVIDLAKELKAKAWTPVHKHLLDYLLTDEAKHDRLLEQLGELKKGMYPYGS